jgi:hypothetical protein
MQREGNVGTQKGGKGMGTTIALGLLLILLVVALAG